MAGTPSNAAIYARISLDHDGKALGVNRQVADCRAMAERLGWGVAEEYVDNDVSAYSGKRRPSYERMLSDISEGTRDAVIVYHVDRLTRRPIELEHFLERITVARLEHVRFVAGADVNIANGDGLMVLRMMAAVAANESASKSRRVKRRLDEVAASGMPHGGSIRPFGFEDDRMTIRPVEAEVLRSLVARYLAGESFRSMTAWLNDEGVPTVTGKEWLSGTLRGVLVSPRLAGLRESRGQVVAKAVWDPIISEEDHRRVLARMEQRSATRERTPRTYLLTGLLRCGRCGNKLFSSRRENSRRYVCLSGPDHRGCGRLTVVSEPLEQLVMAAVLYRLDTPELTNALRGRASGDATVAALAELVGQDRAQLDELADLYAARQITAREWMTARNPIEMRIRSNERQITNVTRSDSLTGVIGNGHALRATWANLDLSRQAAIVAAIVDHVTIAGVDQRSNVFDPNRAEITWRL